MVSDTINIQIVGQYGSIDSTVEWTDVPRLAVLSGVNGSGKTQLLDVLASTFGAWPQTQVHPHVPRLEPGARAVIGIESYMPAEVRYVTSEWRILSAGTSSRELVLEAVKSVQLHFAEVLRRPRLPHDPQSIPIDAVSQRLLTRIGAELEEVVKMDLDDLLWRLTPRFLTDFSTAQSRENIAFAMIAYRVFEGHARDVGISDAEILDKYGEPPWDTMNRILSSAGLSLRIAPPEPQRKNAILSSPSFIPYVTDEEQSKSFPLANLSSGERAIMSMAFWFNEADTSGQYPRLLLLDEPDAHLHPSLTRRFLNVLKDIFIEQGGARVIMTTHSPSTVALVPESSLFEMRRTMPRISPAASKQSLISVLTDGFVAVQEATQTVFVEGKEDSPFFLRTWELLTDKSDPTNQPPLEPYPNLLFVYGKGKEVIQTMVPQLRSQGLTSFFGVTDRDTGNAPGDGVRVLRRYSMENYLLDPLCVWFVLSQEGHAPPVQGVKITQWREADLARLRVPELQAVADTIFGMVTAAHPVTEPADLETEGVEFIDGKVLQYPRWFLNTRGKDLKQWFRDGCQPQFIKTDKLLTAFSALRMVPRELLDIMKAIQAGER